MEEITGHDRLVGCWVVMPHHTGEMPAPHTLVAEMIEQGVKAARIFPARTTHNWSLAPWSSGELFGALETARCPVFVGHDQVTWDGIAALCNSFPELPVVVTETRYTEYRTLYPLLDSCRNLFVELCWMPVHWGIEAAVERFGPERFLFGTNMPMFTAGPAINHLVYSALRPGDLAQIVGGNLRRLLEWSSRDGQ